MSHLILYIYLAALNVLYFSGLYKLAAPFTRGKGVIFTLHQVNDEPQDPFSPNSILTVTPDFLERTIKTVQSLGYDIISLEEMSKRCGQENTVESQKPFAVFTLDDGYRDNKQIAQKIFQKYNAPFTIYIVSEYSSHKGELWWLALEEIIRQSERVKNPYQDNQTLETSTTVQKYKAFDQIYWPMRQSNQPRQREVIRQMAKQADYDIDQLTKDLIMNWEELRDLQKDPLVTLAAHTKSHFALSRISADDAKEQVIICQDHMERELGERPEHFSYPYGSQKCAGPRDFKILNDLGVKTAVTTRKGVIYDEHSAHHTALPRISLNGEYQKQRYVEVLMSGLPSRIYNFWNKLDVK